MLIDDINSIQPSEKRKLLFVNSDGSIDIREVGVYELLVDREKSQCWLSSANSRIISPKNAKGVFLGRSLRDKRKR